MPVKHAIWKVGKEPQRLSEVSLGTEQVLEDMIVSDPRILSDEWMLIGRQEETGHGGRIDLLGIAPDGTLVLIELKRSRTPREVVAQALDYAGWVEGLSPERIAEIYSPFSNDAVPILCPVPSFQLSNYLAPKRVNATNQKKKDAASAKLLPKK